MEQAIFLVLDCTSVLVLKADAYSSLTVGSDEIINNRQCWNNLEKKKTHFHKCVFFRWLDE